MTTWRQRELAHDLRRFTQEFLAHEIALVAATGTAECEASQSGLSASEGNAQKPAS